MVTRAATRGSHDDGIQRQTGAQLDTPATNSPARRRGQRVSALLAVAVASTVLLLPGHASADPEAPDLVVGESYSMEAENFPGMFLRHRNFLVELTGISDAERADATFRVVPGLAGDGISFESVNFPGYFLRHQNFELKLHRRQRSALYRADATFFVREGFSRTGPSWAAFESYNFPDYYLRHQNFRFWLQPEDGSHLYERDATLYLHDPLA